MISLTRTLRVCVPLAAAAALAMAGTAFGGSDPNCSPDHGACAFSGLVKVSVRVRLPEL